MTIAPLLAASRTYLQFARLQSLDEWWHWGALASVMLAVVALIVFVYRRDSIELPRPLRYLLFFLRLAAFGGLLLFFLGLEKRSEELVIRNSRAILLVDTSQSMALMDEAAGDVANPGVTRIARVVEALQGELGLIETLRGRHDVVVHRCDEGQRPVEVAAYPTYADRAASTPSSTSIGSLTEARWLAGITALLTVMTLVALVLASGSPSFLKGAEGENWALLAGVVFLLATLVVAAVNSLRNSEYGWRELITGHAVAADDASVDGTEDDADLLQTPVALAAELKTKGVATRLGDAVADLVERERGGPIAGIAVLTDGNSNAGLAIRDAANLAAKSDIVVFPIGLGNDRPPTNARVVDLEAPARVYPGDGFKVRGYLQAFGCEGQSLAVRLLEALEPVSNAPDGEGAPALGGLIDERLVRIDADGDVIAVEFEVAPTDKGRYVYTLEVAAPANDVDASDDQRSAKVRVIDRKTTVLLFAGGPTREYRFLRNLCYRDEEVTVDVRLQSSTGAAAQEADEVLDEFPTDALSLFRYDAIVAIDPDWDQLSESQVQLLEQWVAEKAGGLIAIAGPVYTPEWTGHTRTRPGVRLLRSLYPVQFYSRTSAALGRNRYSARDPWPLEFTEEGRAADHLRLWDDVSSSQGWEDFAGVHGYFPLRGIKPAATVLARFSNPNTKIEGELPPFLVYQFYGAGRVYYIGSGELWRLHEVSDGSFERFYTKLIRFVSEGRLLRDSNRGVLLLDKNRASPGETIAIRCTLTDAQFNPAQLPKVEATVVFPDERRQLVTLSPVRANERPGNYVGQITLSATGDYQIEVPVPDSPDLEILSKSLRVRVPDREIENPQRNDAKLLELADLTGGTYFVGTEAALRSDQGGLGEQILPQDQQTYVSGTPDRGFQQRLMLWYLLLICGTLSAEWLVRRLNRLA